MGEGGRIIWKMDFFSEWRYEVITQAADTGIDWGEQWIAHHWRCLSSIRGNKESTDNFSRQLDHMTSWGPFSVKYHDSKMLYMFSSILAQICFCFSSGCLIVYLLTSTNNHLSHTASLPKKLFFFHPTNKHLW